MGVERLSHRKTLSKGGPTVNLAVDCVDEKPGLPKALNPIRPSFDYLLKKQ